MQTSVLVKSFLIGQDPVETSTAYQKQALLCKLIIPLWHFADLWNSAGATSLAIYSDWVIYTT